MAQRRDRWQDIRTGLVEASGRAVAALEQLAGGMSTAALALSAAFLVLITLMLCVVGIGFLMVPTVLGIVHSVAGRERARLTRWGEPVLGPAEPVVKLAAVLRDPTTRRELLWLPVHGVFGLALGFFGVLLPVLAFRDATFPLWYPFIPPEYATASIGVWTVHGGLQVFVVFMMGVGWTAILLGLSPGIARLQGWPGRRLLAPPPGTDLSGRIAELTSSRAAALDAHATELRRIERSLHDGTQNRMVAVTMLLGAARRALARENADPAVVDQVLAQAQDAAEDALKELRGVVRSILPPVIEDRGLAGALSGLAANCAVPTTLDVAVPGRCAASVEATAYFVVAEALTNVARHSGAASAAVRLRRRQKRLIIEIEDDGHGGADESAGSGLVGLRRRVGAHDGTVTLSSPAGGPTMLKVELPCGS
ncbi:histidine kinase [Kineosporia sp. NBRC 101677]|uniref:sensor histidine kinase n=1 Tax=Kineosporia sp. NBRC 101677 TaxID=3032197 RepID=UPI0024A0BACF|nr:sensor histidine kinase [Kineosporia sp. NBRC 101677]GLY18964.1 histidine kinase [Kineosporia sp. NBRC 101677]